MPCTTSIVSSDNVFVNVSSLYSNTTVLSSSSKSRYGIHYPLFNYVIYWVLSDLCISILDDIFGTFMVVFPLYNADDFISSFVIACIMNCVRYYEVCGMC